MTESPSSSPNQAPDSPRVLTAQMRFRVLAAKPVSMLLLICLIILLVCVYTARGHIQDFYRIRRLRSIGLTTQAVVTEINEHRLKGRGERGASREYAVFEFTPLGSPQSQPVSDERLASLFLRQVRPGDTLDVVYDPASPENFFCPEVDDHSLLGRLSAQVVFLLIALVLLLLALLRYFILLNIVRRSPVRRGTVVDLGPTAQGAFSRLLVISLHADDQDIIIKRVVPFRFVRHLVVGDSVDLLVPAVKPRRAVLAAAFL